NETAREILVVPPGRATGRPFQDVVAQAPELLGRLEGSLHEGTVVRLDEVRLQLPGVGRRDIGLTISPLKGRDGLPTGVLCLLTDLTEMKRLQELVRL